ncbi:hypothetical protein YC2023_055689 [Brassica napus]
MFSLCRRIMFYIRIVASRRISFTQNVTYGERVKTAQEVLDYFFRVRKVIILLETCGHYFDRGSSKKRLDQFLIRFQRYVLSKGHLPLDIEFDLQITSRSYVPLTRYATIDEVNAAILQLEEREHAYAADTTRPGISSNGKGAVIDGEAHKQQTKQMLIPSDCSLVQSTKQKEAADLEEKQDIKRLVLARVQ